MGWFVPTKGPPVKFRFALLQFPCWSLACRWPLLVPIGNTGSSCPQREVISSCFSSWATRGGFIFCTLMSSHFLPTFSEELSLLSCSQMRKGKKKPFWSREGEPGESSRTEVFQEGWNRAKNPRPWAKPFQPPAVPLLHVDSCVQNVPNALGKTHLWMSPRAAASTGLVQSGCKVFCAILHSGLFCNDMSNTSPGSECFSLENLLGKQNYKMELRNIEEIHFNWQWFRLYFKTVQLLSPLMQLLSHCTRHKEL